MKNLYYETLVSCLGEIKNLLDKYQHVDDIIAGVQVFGLNDAKLDKISQDWIYKGSFNYNRFITQLTRSIIKLSKNLSMSNKAHGTITIRVDVASFGDFDRIMKLVTKDYTKSSRNFKKYVEIETDPGNDGYSFDIDFLMSSIYNDYVNQNLFESFNGFADDASLAGKQSFITFYNRLKSKYKPANKQTLYTLKESIIDSYNVSDDYYDFIGKVFLKRLTKEELLVCFPDCYANIKDLSLRIENIPEFDEDDYIYDGEFDDELYDSESRDALYGSIETNTFYLEAKGSNKKVISTVDVDNLPDVVVKKLIKFLS